MSSPELLSYGWQATLGFTLGVCVVALLRRACRRLFAPELAAWLWIVPLMAMMAASVPHVEAAMPDMPAVVLQVTSAPGPWIGMARVDAPVLGVAWFAVMIWLIGAALACLMAVLAQWRYRLRLRNASPLDSALPWPVIKATDASVGPALVGAWRPRIVLPADFQQRYEPAERALILAHEAMHARRRDGWWCLLAQAVASLLWFHPAAWWALRALRLDLELACDAAVLRECDMPRAVYARAMLKTQITSALLPVGCSWSSSHPITERVVMLKRIQPGRARRLAGGLSLGLLSAALCAVVYASTGQSAGTYHPDKDTVLNALQGARVAQDALGASTARPQGNPAGNAALGLPAPDSGAFGTSVRRLEVQEGGHILVTLADAHGAMAGHLDLEMHPVEQIGSVDWSCYSPDIPEVKQLAASCAYMPGAGGHTTADLLAVDRFTFDLVLSINGAQVDKATKVCLRRNEPYHFSRAQDAIVSPVQGDVSLQPIAGGQVEIQTHLQGGIIASPIHPVLHAFPGQAATIQVGEKIDGDHPADRTVKLDVTATPGCA